MVKLFGIPWFVVAAVAGAAVPSLQAEPRAVPVTAYQAPKDDPILQQLIVKLGKLGEQLARAQQPREFAAAYCQQADLLGQIARRVRPEERTPCLKEMADCLHAAALSSLTPEKPAAIQLVKTEEPASGGAAPVAYDKLAYEQLVLLENELVLAQPYSPLTAYVTYREMQAARLVQANAETAGKDTDKKEAAWRERLAQLVEAYPTAEDTPAAVLELANLCETQGQTTAAQGWYRHLVKHFPEDALASKAEGSLRRLALPGQVFHLALPLLNSDYPKQDVPFDLDGLRGKVVVVYFWTSEEGRSGPDFERLSALLHLHAGKGLALVCVNLDKTPQEAREFLKSHPAAGVHVFQRGGIEGLVAQRYGIQVLPGCLIVDREGKVLSYAQGLANLEDEMQKILK